MDINPQIQQLLASLGIPPELPAARGLPLHLPPAELVERPIGKDGRLLPLAPATAVAWDRLHATAAQDGIALYIVSAYRSLERQTAIFQAKLARGLTLDAILAANAPPGYSEHHSGRALDIGSPGYPDLEEAFEKSPAFAWLQAHAPQHGFTLSFPRDNRWGYIYEPWHWFYGEAQRKHL